MSAHYAEEPVEYERMREIEYELREIFATALEDSTERVDAHQRFVDMGADSAILVDALQRITRRFGIQLELRELFEKVDTIHELVSYVARALPAEPRVVEGVNFDPTPPATTRVRLPAADETAIETTIALQLEALARVIHHQLDVLGGLKNAGDLERALADVGRVLERPKPNAGNGPGDGAMQPARPLRRNASDPGAPVRVPRERA